MHLVTATAKRRSSCSTYIGVMTSQMRSKVPRDAADKMSARREVT